MTPAAPTVTPSGATPSGEPTPGPVSSGGAPACVLVADDEPSIVLSLEFLLKKAGYRVRIARTGGEVLTAMAAEAPDLVLLDAMMPERDGYDVCQAIRANPAWAGIPVIMLTAKSREVERQKGLSLGASDYVTKPFSTRDLVDTVRRHLEGVGKGATGGSP